MFRLDLNTDDILTPTATRRERSKHILKWLWIQPYLVVASASQTCIRPGILFYISHRSTIPTDVIDHVTPLSHFSLAHDGRSRCISIAALNMMDALDCISGQQT
jgi:hypothetical protein